VVLPSILSSAPAAAPQRLTISLVWALVRVRLGCVADRDRGNQAGLMTFR
jgi:hypothetical protein